MKDGTLIQTQNGMGFGEYVYNRAGGFFYYPATAALGMFNQGGSAFLGINLGNGLASCTGEMEIGTGSTGAGVILKSPDGTRYRLTIANGGTVTVAAV